MLISCTVAAQLICTFVFVYASCRFSLDMVQMIYDMRNLLFAYLKNKGAGIDSFYAPNFEKVGDILVLACPCVCVCMGHRDITLKLHVWIPHGKIADAYFWFSLNYPPLLNYGPLTNKGMKFCKCCISKSIIGRNLKLVSADRG